MRPTTDIRITNIRHANGCRHDEPAAHGDANDAAIASSIVAMAHSLGLKVIAEGVETPEQLAFLREQGCEEFQGFLFSRAVPNSDFGEMMSGKDALSEIRQGAG